MMAFFSCTTRPVEPSRESRQTIDTLFQKTVVNLQPSMDSLCRIYGDSIFQAASDSMLSERMAEMKELVK
jgi:hypothetical protein